ncbi:MAG: PepSY-like domain-containing protein [Tidjanibacter sp.]|nr:hypothetical protein [Rikenellaceae bacterium]MBQ8334842.1 PepSY-like domain-containing protein [Tidjanibacter sp.]
MKRTTSYLLLLAALALFGLQSCDKDDHYINQSLLPTPAQNFLSAHFGSVEVTSVVKDFDDFSYTYEVRLADGTHIEFRKDGDWKSVSNRTTGVPAAIMPDKIVEYVTTNYPNNFVIEIERDRQIDIELNDGLDLDFTSSGDFIRIDK